MKKLLATFTAFSVLFLTISISATPKNKKDLVEMAVEAGQFKILTKALEAADLVDVLKKNGKFTVFAPTDEAFGKLPKGTLETLLKPENKEKLRSILLYHVVNAKLSAKKVKKLNGRKLVTLNGNLLKIEAEEGVKVNDSNIVIGNVKAQNGIIHAIDTVLIPSEK